MPEHSLSSGDLRTTRPVRLLIAAIRTRATGVLSLQQGNGFARMYLREGRFSGCQVAQGFKPLSRYLLEAGLIDVPTINRSLVTVARTQAPHGQVLLQMGAVSAVDLEAMLLRQQLDYLTRIVDLEEGAYRFEPGGKLPGWARDVPSPSPCRVVLVGLERPSAHALIEESLQAIGDAPIVLTDEAVARWDELELTEEESKALAHLDAPGLVDDVIVASPLGPDKTRTLIAALWLLGLLQKVLTFAVTDLRPEDPTAREPLQQAERAFSRASRLVQREGMSDLGRRAPPKDVVYEALLEASQTWLNERDASRLEAKLSALLDQIGGPKGRG